MAGAPIGTCDCIIENVDLSTRVVQKCVSRGVYAEKTAKRREGATTLPETQIAADGQIGVTAALSDTTNEVDHERWTNETMRPMQTGPDHRCVFAIQIRCRWTDEHL
jgi:hypothetical protein